MGDEGVVRQHRAGRHDLGARHHDAGIGFPLHMAANIANLIGRPIAIDRRMNDGVVDVRHTLLAELVPTARILLIGLIELGVGTQGGEEGGLVVGCAAHPAVRDPRPLRDGIAPGEQIGRRPGSAEISVGHATVAGIRRQQNPLAARGIVERIVKACHHAGGVAERRMNGHIGNALAIQENLAAIPERCEIFLPRLRPLAGDRTKGFRFPGEDLCGFALHFGLHHVFLQEETVSRRRRVTRHRNRVGVHLLRTPRPRVEFGGCVSLLAWPISLSRPIRPAPAASDSCRPPVLLLLSRVPLQGHTGPAAALARKLRPERTRKKKEQENSSSPASEYSAPGACGKARGLSQHPRRCHNWRQREFQDD